MEIPCAPKTEKPKESQRSRPKKEIKKDRKKNSPQSTTSWICRIIVKSPNEVKFPLKCDSSTVASAELLLRAQRAESSLHPLSPPLLTRAHTRTDKCNYNVNDVIDFLVNTGHDPSCIASPPSSIS